MAKKNQVFERINDTSKKFRRLTREEIEEGLGATAVARPNSRVEGSPFSLAALRTSLMSDLVSSGGRPSRREVVSRKKIPLTESEWQSLDEISKTLKQRGVNATSGQVAGVLLHHSLAEVTNALNEQPTDPAPASASKHLSDSDLEETVEGFLAAAASAEAHLEQLRPVALELLRRMRAGRGIEADGDPQSSQD